ncbi:type VII secretion-associated serine protease mycosin [Carbonactinospora thermoautotrophica]|nr:type VII secretion-associated serine protease mycosin [Carbonactinospora thermoautotrophica]
MLLLATSGSATAGVSNQWALQKLRAKEAWKYTQGEGVTVAVLDTGVDATHPDLRGQVVPGKDFHRGTGDGTTDQHGHGTAMASLIAGTGNGSGRVLGLAPRARIYPMVTGTYGSSYSNAREAAIKHAIAQGIKVINISAGGTKDPQLAENSPEKAAIEEALRRDVVIVAAAGNDGLSTPNYPAAYPGVIAVTAVDKNGKPWAETQHGPWVTVAAPGVDIYAAEPGGKYDTGSGTSQATAYVSATVALIRAKFPELSANQVIHRLIKTADDCGPPGRDDYCGYGMINPVRALTEDVGEWPRDKNPLAPELTAAQPTQQPQANDSGEGGPGPVLVWALGGLLAVGAVILVVVLLARRGSGRDQPPGGGGWPPPGPPGPYGPPPGPQYQQAGAPPGPWPQPGPPPPPGWQPPQH